MDENRCITMSGFSNRHIILVVCILGMIISSLYLFWHHFALLYPTTLVSSSICEINQFFSCNAVAFSWVSQIAGVPISMFGIVLGGILLFSSFYPGETKEKTNRILTFMNFVGCIALFLYSIIFLKHVCPVCTLYYIFSTGVFIMYFRYGLKGMFSLKIIGIYAVITFVIGVFTFSIDRYHHNKMYEYADQYIKQFDSYPNLGTPKQESPYKLVQSTKNFKDAPIRISIFSDFKCPACSYFASITSQIIKRFKDKMNVQFYFYPLDGTCNPDVGSMNPECCKAAYLAACLPDKFHLIHDELFANSSELTSGWLDAFAKKHGVYECMFSKETKEKVVKLMEAAVDFNIRATPTTIINGVKIEGALAINHITILFNELVKRHERK